MSSMIAVIMAANIAGCSPSTDAEAAFHAIEETNAKAMAAVAEGDIETYASLFTEDAWSMPPNSPVSKGRQEILDAFTQMTQFGAVQFNLTALDVSVCGPSAVERGAFTLDFTPFEDTSPIPAFHDEGHYLVHWVEEGGKWLIRTDAPVSTIPLPLPPPTE
ncbi:MAG: hypothetical protein CMK09_19115 [Ponticaulis sp.]|nr:hypothetical protein [Ponticaulis sp.]|tara:strand:+ start:193337 stop:193819 length:483 start_codon:yes stop_codon:yes gene_type:complete